MEELLVIVEDDYYDWEWLKGIIEDAIPSVKLVWISTEKMFRERLQEFEDAKPVGFILDVMLPWDIPRPGQEEEDVPAEVKRDGFYTAGLRCNELLKRHSALGNVPVLLYTGLDKNNFAEHVVHIKSDDPNVLTDIIRQWIS